ncbi:hypothetical protein [Flavobacterium mesophilum]|uniref:hypothetical protein n=1 Tax=Flavobacterium mesophilum TaxID=3143495 RepID=UPI0031DE285F
MYRQLINYRDELKINSRNNDEYILTRIEKEKTTMPNLEASRIVLLEYEKSFEKLKYKERDKIIMLRDSFNNKHNLYLHFDTFDYSNVSDTLFNRLMEIDFYRIQLRYQERNLLRRGCI